MSEVHHAPEKGAHGKPKKTTEGGITAPFKELNPIKLVEGGTALATQATSELALNFVDSLKDFAPGIKKTKGGGGHASKH